MGIENMRILSTKRDQLLKLVFCGHADELAILSDAVFAAGARDLRSTEAGRQGRVECIVPNYRKGAVLAALAVRGNPHQPPVFHLLPTLDSDVETGTGMIGSSRPMTQFEFLAMVKEKFGCGGIRGYADAGVKPSNAWHGAEEQAAF